MKINFEAPDEWEKLLDEEAKKDGHSNRAAVIRKIVNLFFANKQNFLEHCTQTEAQNDLP
jgi:hypothetical protein